VPSDYLSEFDLGELGIDPNGVLAIRPRAIESFGDDTRCWSTANLLGEANQ
jgi:hypothetical protein